MALRPATLLTCSALGLAVGGCASNTGSETGGLTLPKMPSVADMTPSAPEKPVGDPTELYARIARGANACWFAPNGPLKRRYIYDAEADAPSRGSKAEITIHVREPSQPNPRGPKAYRISIVPDGENAKITTENMSMTEVAAKEMTADVERWSRGEQGCAASATAGWTAADPPAPATPQSKKPQKKAAQKAKAAPPAKTAAP